MCGICGLALSSRSTERVDPRMVERMRDVLTHRGPDGEGMYLGDRVGLGHRRLSIIDVAAGAQPMHTPDGRHHIVYNGEIFNHASLRPDLERRGWRYRTRSDTETILYAWVEHGSRAPTLLRGMFAFAIWDEQARELVLVRDRLGVKPLYYALTGDGSIVFGSEIKALFASGLVRPALNESAVPDFLANHAPSGTSTLFAGVLRLPPAHLLRWRDGVVTLERYWDLSFRAGHGEAPPHDRDAVHEYRERLREAVRLRLMSDVPLGMFLSGGIDSATITALMSELVDEPVKTFSVAFAEREANELAYARLVARRFRTDHHEIVVTPREFFSQLPRLVWHEDEPIAHPSSVPLHFVSSLAAQHVKVVLTGEGSDETLAGYGRYRLTAFNMGLGQSYETLTPAIVRRVVQRSIEGLPSRTRVRQKLTRTFLCQPTSLDALFFDNFAVFSRARQARLLSPDARRRLSAIDPYDAAHAALSRCDAPSLLGRLLYADTMTYLVELLMKQDQMSMSASIESRVPFLDHPLVEFAASLPDRLKLRGLVTKYVLRRSMRDTLPAEILTRRKMGFPVPLQAWFRGPFRHVVDEFVLGPRARARGLFDAAAVRAIAGQHAGGVESHASRLWMLVTFEVWQRVFLDAEPIDDVQRAMQAPRAVPVPASA
jgi:asparagine synthase (glutamine-hydrolysing)